VLLSHAITINNTEEALIAFTRPFLHNPSQTYSNMHAKLTIFSVLMALSFSTAAITQEPNTADQAMENLMDRITRLAHLPAANTIPAELAAASAQVTPVKPEPVVPKHEEGKRGLLQDIESDFSDLGGSIKNSTVSLWNKITGQDVETAQEVQDQKTADDLKFINKRGRNAAVPKPVVPHSRNKHVPGTAAIPLTNYKRSTETEKRAALWAHVKRVAAASSKRELQELHEHAKRSDMLDDLKELASGGKKTLGRYIKGA